jgi:hypothetical protein
LKIKDILKERGSSSVYKDTDDNEMKRQKNICLILIIHDDKKFVTGA